MNCVSLDIGIASQNKWILFERQSEYEVAFQWVI